MPFALTIVGLILIITGFQNTYRQFGAMVQNDFTGPGNFLYWMASVLAVGSLGYVQALQSFSRVFLSLILVALIIAEYKKNPDIFKNIGGGIASGSATPVDPIGAPLAGAGGNAGASGGGSGLDLSNISQGASIAFEVASLL